jgi:hypothetical protein
MRFRSTSEAAVATCLVALAAGLTAAGLWLRQLTDSVYWTGPYGSGHYEQASQPFTTIGTGLLGAALTLVVVSAFALIARRR